MALYAQVIIDIAHTNVDRVFAYSIPAEEAIEVGQRVLVPFGRGNTAKEGYVIALCEQVDVPKERIKPILRKAEGFAALLPEQVRLASWHEKYFLRKFLFRRCYRDLDRMKRRQLSSSALI